MTTKPSNQSRTARRLLVGGALLLGGALALRAARAGRKLETETLARIGGIDGRHVKLEADIRLTNPTGTKLVIKHPYVKIMVDGQKLAENRIKNQEITIEPHTTVNLADEIGEPLVIWLPYQSAVQILGPALGQIVAGTTKVPAEVVVMTKAYAPGLPGINVEVREKMELGATA